MAIYVVLNSVLLWYPKYERQPNALKGSQGQMKHSAVLTNTKNAPATVVFGLTWPL